MTKTMWSLILLSSSSLFATAAQAQPLGAAAEWPHTGVGRAITEQGNAALATLRDQFKREIKLEIQAQLEQMLDQQATLAVSPTNATVALNAASAVH